MQVPEEAAVAASGLQAAREDQLRGCAPYLWFLSPAALEANSDAKSDAHAPAAAAILC